MIGALRVQAVRWHATHHATAADALAGVARAPVPPAYALLVGRARRFTSLVTQLHVEVCGPLHALADAPPAGVFATCHGEIRTAEALMADLPSGAVSSARFAQSVHNTASGAYAVAVGGSAPTTTLTGANALAAGWLEAATTVLDGQHVLLSIADEPVPERFAGPAGDEGVAAAFLLTPADVRLARAELDRRVTLAIVPGASEARSLRTTLAAACRAIEEGAGTVTLGPIAPGAVLELRVEAA